MKPPASNPLEDKKLERRSKKALRHEKQRAANPLRARKMGLARKEALAAGDIKRKKASLAKTHIGCSGWFYWDWRGIFYPADLPTSDWFKYYSSRFKTVELNASFYSWPTISNVQSWAKQAGKKNFIYTVKVCELITHIKRFRGTRELIQNFYYIADLLGPAMGCFLFQLPPSYKYSPARLKSILSQLDHTQRNVIEFRHGSWWNQAVFSAFRKTGTIFCSCSAPKLPDELIKTADEIYVRFHGTEKWYRHDYNKHELSVWTQRIKESRAKRIWVYFNNDYGGNAIKNARELMRCLKP